MGCHQARQRFRVKLFRLAARRVRAAGLATEGRTDLIVGVVRRTQDPGLLEYLGNDLLRMRVFPIPAHGDQKVALSFTSVAPREGAVVEYVYPLKTDGKATRTLEDFSITRLGLRDLKKADFDRDVQALEEEPLLRPVGKDRIAACHYA